VTLPDIAAPVPFDVIVASSWRGDPSVVPCAVAMSVVVVGVSDFHALTRFAASIVPRPVTRSYPGPHVYPY